jgi:Flp pilus assembly protein TadB
VAELRESVEHRQPVATGSEQAEKSVSALVKQGTEQISQLVRQEMQLAQAELAHKGRRAGIGGGLFGAAALAAVFGAAALVVTVIAALPLSVWAASLVVAGALLVLAGVLGLLGRRQLSRAAPPVPGKAVESVKDDLETIKERAKR